MGKPSNKGKKGKGGGKTGPTKTNTEDNQKGKGKGEQSFDKTVASQIKSASKTANKYAGPIPPSEIKKRGIALANAKGSDYTIVTNVSGDVSVFDFVEGKPRFKEEQIPKEVVKAFEVLNSGDSPVSERTHYLRYGKSKKEASTLVVKKKIVKNVFSASQPGSKVTEAEMRNPANKSLDALVKNVDDNLDEFIPVDIQKAIFRAPDPDAAAKTYASFSIQSLDPAIAFGAFQRDMAKVPYGPLWVWLHARLENDETTELKALPEFFKDYSKKNGATRAAAWRMFMKHDNFSVAVKFLAENWSDYYTSRMTAAQLEKADEDWDEYEEFGADPNAHPSQYDWGGDNGDDYDNDAENDQN